MIIPLQVVPLLCMVVPMIISLIALVAFFTLLDYCVALRFNSLIMGPSLLPLEKKLLLSYATNFQLHVTYANAKPHSCIRPCTQYTITSDNMYADDIYNMYGPLSQTNFQNILNVRLYTTRHKTLILVFHYNCTNFKTWFIVPTQIRYN
jgi:hypothetical protein